MKGDCTCTVLCFTEPSLWEYRGHCACTMLCFSEHSLGNTEGAALAQSCVSQSQVWGIRRAQRLQSLVFLRVKSGENGGYCAYTVLYFKEPSLGNTEGTALAQSCASKSQIWGIRRVLRLHSLVFQRAMSGVYGRRCACRVLCFTEPSPGNTEGAALAESCVSQSQIWWIRRVLHLSTWSLNANTAVMTFRYHHLIVLIAQLCTVK